MGNRFLKDPSDNIFNYYILPLIGLNKVSFGDCFIKTLLNKSYDAIFVQVASVENKNKFLDFPYFESIVEHKTGLFFKFSIPAIFSEDIKLIGSGKYSLISIQAKTFIKSYSGLAYNVKSSDGKTIVSKALLALDKHVALIEYYADYLGLTEKEIEDCITIPDIELMDEPYENDFIENFKMEKSV